MVTALTMYTLSTAIHVVFVVSFLATAGAFSVLGPMAKEKPQHVTFALAVEKKIFEALVFPGILVVWGTGLYQASDGGWKGSDLWLTISVILFAYMTIVALFVLYPATKSALTEIEGQSEPGPPSAKAQSDLKKLGMFGPLQGLSMLIITFLMVAKPF
jgi:uncharacterized membrane protein